MQKPHQPFSSTGDFEPVFSAFMQASLATPSPVQTLGSVTGTFNPALGIGYNRVCVLAEGGDSNNDEATNCITIVGMPTGG